MNRITKKFDELISVGKTAFMPFVIAGDPDFRNSLEIVRLLNKYSDLLEIGFPYSDPLADGPVIQAADFRALQSGMNPNRFFKFVKSVRKFTEVPITALVYANIIYQYGIDSFYREARNAGIDGVLVPDLPVEEAVPYIQAAKNNEVYPIFLVTQTTSDKRLKKILKSSKGYLYLVTVLGVTGERKNMSKQTLRLIDRVKAQSDLPVCAGFGISTPKQVSSLKKVQVEGIIIGSAIIRIIGKNRNRQKILQNEIDKYVKSITE